MSATEQRLQELTNIAPSVSVKMDMEWLGATTNTADFQIRLTSTDTTAVKLLLLYKAIITDELASLLEKLW
jgi:hypothetical protein